MSSTQTVPPKTVTKKNRQPSPAETARQERHSRRDTSRLVALERETTRKETRAAKRELEKIRQESAKLETHVTQLRAALSKNCPSSNNVVFQSRLIKAENELRKLHQLHAKVRLRLAIALADQSKQSESRSASPSPAMASGSVSRAASPGTSDFIATEELRTFILAEVTKAKEAAQQVPLTQMPTMSSIILHPKQSQTTSFSCTQNILSSHRCTAASRTTSTKEPPHIQK